MGLMAIAFSAFFLAFMLPGGVDGPPLFAMGVMWTLIALVYGMMTVPSLVAGFGLLKGRKWARTASIISAVLAGGQFPIGTAVCVYTFWFLFSEPGKQIFDRAPLNLPAAHQEWWRTPAGQIREKELAPPTTPPDWR